MNDMEVEYKLANTGIGGGSFRVDVDFELYGFYGISFEDDTMEGSLPILLCQFLIDD